MSKLKFHSLNIKDVKPVTDSAVCITFDIPDDLKETFSFTQGQFLTLRSVINGEEVRRSYSICSGVDDGALQVGIKRVTNGKFSNYANDEFAVNSSVDVMPPQGSFFTQLHSDNEKEYICIAAGSGITPILSIVKSILSREPNSKVTLIYGNRRTTSMMFKDEISNVKNASLGRFTWINIMSAEDQGTDLLNGKINNEKGAALHKAKLIDIGNVDDVFICGPEAMMSDVSRGFRASGLSEDNIHYELFANSAEDSEKILEKYQERVEEYGENKTSKVTLRADGRAVTFDLALVGENILDAGMHNGLDLPYACKAGVCSTCKAKLVSGKVDMDLSHGLEQHEIDDGYILTCQAHPISDHVEVDFDQRK